MADAEHRNGISKLLEREARSTSCRSLAIAGLVAVALAGVGGFAVEGLRLGWSEASALAVARRDVERRFDGMVATLDAVAVGVARQPQVLERGAGGRSEDLWALLEQIRVATDRTAQTDLAITVYDANGATALAWIGRPSEMSRVRLSGPSALFVAPGPLGLRLVHVEPIVDHPASRRLGVVAVEDVLSPAQPVGSPTGADYRIDTSIAPVSLQTARYNTEQPVDRFVFSLRSPDGEMLLEARVAREDLARARHEWRLLTGNAMLGALGLTILALTGPLLGRRRNARRRAHYLFLTTGAAAMILAARLLLWLATPANWVDPPTRLFTDRALTLLDAFFRSPINLLLTSLTALALAALAADAVLRFRLAIRTRRRVPAAGGAWAMPAFVLLQVAAATIVVVLLAGYHYLLRDTVDNAGFDVLHFSFHPWNWSRLALLFGLVFLAAALAWTSALVFLAALASWRVSRRDRASRILLLAAWTIPLLSAVTAIRVRDAQIPVLPTLLVAALSMMATCNFRRGSCWYRHASQASRLFALLLAIVVPAVLTYPSVLYYADRAKRSLIETEYAVQAIDHPKQLQVRLDRALTQIDGIGSLAESLSALSLSPGAAPDTEAAFGIWRNTDLAEFRLTSAVELYDPAGTLVSRFALNLPEYGARPQRWEPKTCKWDVFGEAVPFGSEDRRVLHAERGVCTAASHVAGAVVVHVMFDYGALPFISSQSPYFEFFRGQQQVPQEGMPGGDIELVVYGWGRLPIYRSATRAWPLDEDLFSRIYASRVPFWTRLSRSDSDYNVFFLNDRAGIYAIGYPALHVFDHLVHLAEVCTLAAVAFAVLLTGAFLFNRTVRPRPELGRILLREVRTSFYRKLFLAFVAVSIVPILTLAFVIRLYFATGLRLDVESGAARTSAVAQRVVEELAALLQRSAETADVLSDDVMVWISELIDQDVNIFDGSRLIATSERDLFASGLLPVRTPHNVYQAIVLQRLPSWVGEDAIGSFRYMLAAAPVRAAGRDAILTVPITLRQRDVEREIDDLDRGVLLATLVFVLLGAAIGLSMAERIADPVNRLTRATRRIAKGDFDSHVAVKSADELRRLVDAFNSMAAELKRQRGQLERTHRLEAWAEMARQVAHEIKNPLTPIQLSAEHLLRVNTDRGEPLSPVLDGCVHSILAQVRLLRQIAAEFSSFASSPSARCAPTAVKDLIEEVIEPYRPGLGDRIAIRVDIPAFVPPLNVDRTLLGRALSNVIENALHAMPGQGTLTVAVRFLENSVGIDITDTGVGMDNDALERIFEPYFSTKAIGTGLGLTIAKRNVELCNGVVEVASQRDRGTTVTFVFPVPEPGPQI